MTTLQHQMRVIGGYQGPALPQPAYLGSGTLVVLGAGLVVWRRDRRLWLFGALGVVAVVFSLGLKAYWTPWRVVEHVPLVRNVVAGRFASLTALCAAVMLAVIVDRTRRSVAVRVEGRSTGAGRHAGAGGTRGRRRWARSGRRARRPGRGGSWPSCRWPATWPATCPSPPRRSRCPAWFADVGPHLPPGQVVLAYPAPFALQQSAEGWQAHGRPGLRHRGWFGAREPAQSGRAGTGRPGRHQRRLLLPLRAAARRRRQRRRRAERTGGVGGDHHRRAGPTGLPRYEQGTDPAAALGLFTLAVGRAPSFVDDAWVWTGVRRLGPRRAIGADAFAGCTSTARRDGAARLAVPACVLAASRPAG